MGETTGIEWTDATWTPVRARMQAFVGQPRQPTTLTGWHCEHVSEGCRNCYAETMNKRLGTGLDYKPGNLSPRGPVEMFLDAKLLLAPLKWRKPKRIFVCSMTDLFADFVPDAFIDRMFAVMALCPQHSYQVLTKRPERMRDYMAHVDMTYRVDCEMDAIINERVDPLNRRSDDLRAIAPDIDETWPLPNVWLGVSVEDQAAADARIPLLLDTPAAVRFLSCEPLLGPVDLRQIYLRRDGQHPTELSRRLGDYCQPLTGNLRESPRINWVIAGGESGPGARPMHPDWARGLRDQCAAAGVPFLFKQWGEWIFADFDTCDATHWFGPVGLRGRGKGEPWQAGDVSALRVGKKRAGRLLDGVQHDGMPG